MKKKEITYLLLLLVCLLQGCTEYAFDHENDLSQEALLFVGITTDNAVTTSGEDTRAGINEYELKNAVVLVYNANRVFEKSGIPGADGTLQLTLKEGKKYIFVIANPGSELKNKLEASPSYTQLNEMISLSGDYNAGNYPSQGLLMTGKVEKMISTGQVNEATVPLTIRSARIDLYINKGSAEVEDITLSSVSLKNARTTGYLFKDNEAATTVSDNVVTLLSTKITSIVANGTLVGTQYTYPAINAINISFQIVAKHANASANDTYTVYLNTSNDSSSVTLQQGYHYKVLITFSKDETGTVSVTGYTTKNNIFEIG